MTSEISVQAVFSIGSNYGDRYMNVKEGIDWLSEILCDFCTSAVYATPDCHGSQKQYMNAVVRGSTCLSPEKIVSLCKEYESSCGRDDAARAEGNVPVDIDLVIYDSVIVRPKDFAREFFKIGYRQI